MTLCTLHYHPRSYFWTAFQKSQLATLTRGSSFLLAGLPIFISGRAGEKLPGKGACGRRGWGTIGAIISIEVWNTITSASIFHLTLLFTFWGGYESCIAISLAFSGGAPRYFQVELR
jgi:hypothetical protein